MKFRVKTEQPLMVIDKSKKDYDFNGNKGTTYKIITMMKHGEETQVDEVRVSADVYASLKPMTYYNFIGNYETRNGRLEFDVCTPDGPPSK